jgi:hypothetical protein
MDLIYEIFSEANFLATAMMILVAMYWLLMVTGVAGMDSLDLDVDVDMDVGIDVDAGMDVGADLDVDPSIEVDAVQGSATEVGGADFETGGGTAGGNSGSFVKTVFEFFYLSEVPVVIVASAFLFGFWVSGLVLNHYFNPDLTFNRSLLFIPSNLAVAAAVTKVIVWPLAILNRSSAPEDLTRSKMIGRVGVVTTSVVTNKFGRMETKVANEPEITLNIRVADGQELAQGDAAKILSYNNDTDTYLVESTTREHTK